MRGYELKYECKCGRDCECGWRHESGSGYDCRGRGCLGFVVSSRASANMSRDAHMNTNSNAIYNVKKGVTLHMVAGEKSGMSSCAGVAADLVASSEPAAYASMPNGMSTSSDANKNVREKVSTDVSPGESADMNDGLSEGVNVVVSVGFNVSVRVRRNTGVEADIVVDVSTAVSVGVSTDVDAGVIADVGISENAHGNTVLSEHVRVAETDRVSVSLRANAGVHAGVSVGEMPV